MAYNVWSREWLNEFPEAAYGAYRPQTGSRSFLDYWKGQQGNVYNDWWERMGSMARLGQPPNLEFPDFLQGYPWMQRWWELSPSERGERPTLFAPNVRWQV